MRERAAVAALVVSRLAAIRGDGDLFRRFYCWSNLGGGNGELAEFDVNVELRAGVEADIVCPPRPAILSRRCSGSQFSSWMTLIT